MIVSIFWDVMLYRLVYNSILPLGTFLEMFTLVNTSEECAWSQYALLKCLYYQIARCHIAEDSSLHSHHPESVESGTKPFTSNFFLCLAH